MTVAAGEPVPLNDLVCIEKDGTGTRPVLDEGFHAILLICVSVKHMPQLGDVPSAREGASLLCLPGSPSALLFLFGGCDDQGQDLNDLHIFQVTSKRWKKGELPTSTVIIQPPDDFKRTVMIKGDVPGPRLNHAAVLSGSTMLLHGTLGHNMMTC